ncbi:MAG: hypothetical protein KY475_17620 [Planctomycetes bacterium]|nr:hypothetical protein [Planctomycetota bacterium]
MAKKRKAPLDPIVTEGDDGVFIVDTGLYRHHVQVPAKIRDAPERLFAIEELRRLRNDAKRNAKDAWRQGVGSSPTVEIPGAVVSLTSHNTAWALDDVTQHIDWFLRSNPTEREAQIFLAGLNAGRAVEKAELMPYEQEVLREKMRLANLKENNGARVAAAEQKKAEFLACYRRHRTGKVSHTAAVTRAAGDLQIPRSTAWEYAKSLGLSAKK